MQTISKGLILNGLDHAMAFCHSIGLKPDQTRFGFYRRRIKDLVEAIEQKARTGELPQSLENLPDYEYIIPVTEAAEFGDAIRSLHDSDLAPLRKKIGDVLQGPQFPIHESQHSNLARNVLFELNLGGRLRRAGFQPRLGEHPDLTCEVDGKKLLFECKRPFSHTKIKTRIRDARKQLLAELRRVSTVSPGSRGVIAISVTKVLNRGDLFLRGSTELSVRRGLERDVSGIAERVRDAWKQLQGTDIIGILFHLITPAVVEANKMYVVAQQVTGFSLARRGTRDAEVMRTLVSGLRTTHY